MQIGIVFEQTLKLFLMIIVGYILARLDLLDQHTKQKLTKILLSVTTPFMMIDAFAEKCGAKFGKHQFKSNTAMAECGGKRVLLMKPDTFMNLSGQAVTEAMQFYQIPPERVIVIFDDINLNVGELRIRQKGSDGGHNGMKNIIYLSGADTFPRIRVGIGKKPHPDYDLAAWVLSAFSPDELKTLAETAKTVCEALPLMLDGRTDLAMNRYNTGKQKKQKPVQEMAPEEGAS